MGAWLIAGVGVIYVIAAIDFVMTGKPGLAITFVGYAVGNLGLFLVARL